MNLHFSSLFWSIFVIFLFDNVISSSDLTKNATNELLLCSDETSFEAVNISEIIGYVL